MQESEKTARSVAALLLCPVLWCVGLNVAYGDKTEEKVRFTDTIAALGGKNLVPNASFEAGEAGWS